MTSPCKHEWHQRNVARVAAMSEGMGLVGVELPGWFYVRRKVTKLVCERCGAEERLEEEGLA